GALERLSANQSATTGLSEALWWSRSVEGALKASDVHEDGLARNLEDLSDRALAMVENMNFAFLYARQRQIFSIGYRLPDAEGPGRLDSSCYDLLASEARLASFIAIARGSVPQDHWFRLSRTRVSVEGHTALVSWSGSMFEYLMPLVVLRSHPDTLLENT